MGCLLIAMPRRVAAIIMRVTYGYTLKSDDDPMITMPFTSLANFASAVEPGRWIVDFVPQREYYNVSMICYPVPYASNTVRYLPRWMPGTSFLRIAENWYNTERQASWNPYLWCKKQIVRV